MLKKNFDQLTESQKQAVFHISGPLLVLAGPGSGKTRVITYRIASLIDSGINPFNICAITFTNKAADEMSRRTISLGTPHGSHISTFHSLCVRILRRYAEQADIHPNFSIFDDSDQTRCIKQSIKDCALDATNFSPVRVLEAVSSLKNKLFTPEFFKEQADDYFTKSLVKIYSQYQSILTHQNALDFDDLLMKTALLLKENSDVRTEISNRFQYLLIDEYQDTNRAQYEIAKAIALQHGNICVTGDPDQSIYRWRGADIGNILAFEQDWPNASVVKLQENFRSTPNILEVADSLISANKKRKPKKLIPTKPKGSDIVIADFDDEQHEANEIASRIRELAEKGSSLRQMAVFYRVNSMSRVIEEAFIKNRIPYQMVRGVEFYSRKEIRNILAYLKILANPADEIALLRIINTPTRGIGQTTIDKVKSYAQAHKISLYTALKQGQLIQPLPAAAQAKLVAFANMIEQFKKDINGPVAVLAKRVFTESGLEQSLRSAGSEGLEAIENIEELINAAAQFDKQTDNPSLIDYLQQISLFSDVDVYDPDSDRVVLMTLHAAKGLEFDNVFIIGIENGLLPHERSLYDEDQLEEERRLLFVGITRARISLHLSYARYRTHQGQLLRTIPSQFLYELGKNFMNPFRQISLDNSDVSESASDEITLDTTYTQLEPAFAEGELVRHPKFGVGTVKQFTEIGENSTIVVKFSTGQTKYLMLKYAKLVKL